jgi:predicted Zn-dependent peptidase
MGANYNAFNSEENTVYYAAVLPEFQERSIDLLADILRPSLRQDDFDMEKKVIIEEIRMYEDQPPFGADDKIKALHFKRHPLSRSVLGTVASIEGLSSEAMLRYFRDRYSAKNIVVAASGRVDFPALVEAVDGRCGGWESTAIHRERPRAAENSAFQIITNEHATQQYLLQLANAPAAADPLVERYSAKLLSMIVGDDSGSRMYWDLVDPGIAETASFSHYEYEGTGLFMAYACCDPDAASQVAQRIAEIMHEISEEGVTEEELRQAKCKVKSRVVLGSERPRNRLFSVGGNWLARREYRTIREDLAAVDALTPSDIRDLLAKYPLRRTTTLSIGPLAELERPVVGWSSK